MNRPHRCIRAPSLGRARVDEPTADPVPLGSGAGLLPIAVGHWMCGSAILRAGRIAVV